jgi:hypothetical protein
MDILKNDIGLYYHDNFNNELNKILDKSCIT